MKMLSIAISLIASQVAGVASASDYEEKYAVIAQQHQMIERQQSNFDYVLERSHTKKEGVQRIYLAGLSLNGLQIDDSYKTNRLLRERFELSEKDKAGLRSMFSEVMSGHFDNQEEFELVSNARDADLVVAANLLEIAPSAPKDDFHSREFGVKYFTDGSGEMTVAFDIYKHGQLVMKIEDTRDAGRFWQRNTKFANKKNAKALMKTWAKKLTQVI